jgi:hypothetical protein
VASIIAVSLGCATWKDYRDSSGADKADSEVAIFKANLANTRRIVSASDGRIEYQYNPEQKPAPWSVPHSRIRLLPGRFTITAKMWPFDSLNEFEVDLKAGHIYKVETFLCNFECRKNGNPYRHDRWIQDLTERERISSVESECYLANSRQGERWKVPCPDEENDRDSRSADKAKAEETIDEEDNRSSSSAGKIGAVATIDEKGSRSSRAADKASTVVAIDEENNRSASGAGKAGAVAAIVEEDNRDSRSAGEANAAVAIFKANMDNTQRIVSASDGRIEYQYNPELKLTKRSDPHPLIQLHPGPYGITAKTWPFGSLYEFKVDLKAGHIYEIETYLCSFECLSIGEPYRHDRWIQDLTTGERISEVVSECYLGKKRQKERRKVPCPDDK